VPPIYSIIQVILGFGERGFCDPNESGKLGVAIPGEAFCQIPWSRSYGVSDLIEESAIILRT
jgi:hypothetical protein